MKRPHGADLLALVRRRAGAFAGNAVDDLLDGVPSADVQVRRGLPRAAVDGIASFYDQIHRDLSVCDGTSCHFAGGPLLSDGWIETGEAQRVRCLGHCHDAPCVRVGDVVHGSADRENLSEWLGHSAATLSIDADTRPVRRLSLIPAPVVLRNILGGQPRLDDAPDDYALPDGDTILAAVKASGLRGRGGASFPTAAKWEIARRTPATDRVVVCNGDEGDPGAYVDRLLLEEDPHAVLAGMLACARVIGASKGVVYVRAEYPRARAVMIDAVHAATGNGRLEGFKVEVISGAGSYVCGEETALLRSIEGLRGEPRPKPPYPAEVGLYGLPTIVQNVETLAIVPEVVRTSRAAGTKVVCVSGAVDRPSAVEIALGTPLRTVLDACGGPAKGATWRMALIGGPMGRVVPASAFDVPLSYDGLPGFGHGGIVVLDSHVTPGALARHLYDFARAESCGNCTPCRVGTSRLPAMADRPSLERLLDTLEQGSLCGFGQGVPRPVRDLLAHFGDAIFHA